MNFLYKLKSNVKLIQFFKFVIVGLAATGLHYAIYILLQYVNFEYNIAYTLGYFISFIFNFFASNYFTFNSQPNKNRGFKFFLAHFTNYILQIMFLNLFIFLGISEILAPFIVFAICIPINFILVRTALK